MIDHGLANWADLSQIVEMQVSDKLKGKEWLFRGAGSQTHELIPSIGRSGARKDPTTGDKALYNVAEERRMLSEFKRRVRPYLTLEPQNNFEWLAVGQHHGLWTRLLDWTFSPLVAAYFATEGRPESGDKVVIYGIDSLPAPS